VSDGDQRPEQREHPVFTFSLALSHEPHFDSMLADLTGAVLRHVGYPPDAIGELSGAVQHALARGLANGGHQCEVAFRAQAGELHIDLTIVPGSTWRTSKPLP
jgi:hypothetical protein